MAETMRFEQRMSDADALMWMIEKDPLLRSTITAVVVFDRALDHDLLVGRMDRASRLVPRLRQRVVSNPLSIAPPRWEVDPGFDLSYHVRFIRAPRQGTFTDLLRVAEPIAMQGFDRARPLWELVVVDGLADGRSGAVLKLHHSITDGIGAIKIAAVVFDFEREPGDPGPLPEAPKARVMNQLERAIDALEHERRRQLGVIRHGFPALGRAARDAVRDPASAARRSVATMASVGRMLAPATRPMSPMMSRRSLAVRLGTISVSLPEARAAAKHVDGRLNDVFLAAALGGLRRYHDHHGGVPDGLRMTMPINTRGGDTSDLAGNQFAPARFAVPMLIDDPVERIQVVHAMVEEQRAEPALALAELLAAVIRRFGTTVATGLFGSLLKAVDFVTSNVPGVPVPLYLAGAQMVSQFAFGPRAGAAANLTLLSYLDQLHIGVNVDLAAIPDPEVFQACLEDGFDEILKLA